MRRMRYYTNFIKKSTFITNNLVIYTIYNKVLYIIRMLSNTQFYGGIFKQNNSK